MTASPSVAERRIAIDVLRLSPALAVSARLVDALQTSLAIAFVMLGSSLVLAALWRILRAPPGLQTRVLVVGTFAASAEMLLDAFAPVFPHPLTGACVAIVAASGLGFASAPPGARHSHSLTLRRAARLSTVGLLGLTSVGALREWLGHGALLGRDVLGLSAQPPLGFMAQTAGGFFAASVLLLALALVVRGRSRPVGGAHDREAPRG